MEGVIGISAYMEQPDFITGIILRHLQGEQQEGDQEALQAWLDEDVRNRVLLDELMNEEQRLRRLNAYHAYEQAIPAAWEIVASRSGHRNRSMFWWAAAAVFVLASATAVLLIRKEHRTQQSVQEASLATVQPGTARAQLTLANGKVVTLDPSAPDTLRETDGTPIRNASGSLHYQQQHRTGPSNEILYNTLTTPRGGTYEVLLQDGSRVWLNAASALRYPLHFSGKDRTVYLSGEAYFQINKDAEHPFHVALERRGTIEVLGTAFNVMAYDDEQTARTTLLEGSIRIAHGDRQRLLQPGQQALTNSENGSLEVLPGADVEQATAWKRGFFYFDNEDLPYIMRQLSRWYDVDIVYEGDNTGQHYHGAIRRQARIEQVLEKIALVGGLKFSMEGRKVIIRTQ